MIPLFKVFMSGNVEKALIKTLKSGYITQGTKVEKFESSLSNFLNNKYVLSLNSATSGLTLTLKLLKNPCKELNWFGFDSEKDIALTPALTCFAITSSILANS